MIKIYGINFIYSRTMKDNSFGFDIFNSTSTLIKPNTVTFIVKL